LAETSSLWREVNFFFSQIKKSLLFEYENDLNIDYMSLTKKKVYIVLFVQVGVWFDKRMTGSNKD